MSMASCMVSGETWLRSTNKPIRLISRTTLLPSAFRLLLRTTSVTLSAQDRVRLCVSVMYATPHSRYWLRTPSDPLIEARLPRRAAKRSYPASSIPEYHLQSPTNPDLADSERPTASRYRFVQESCEQFHPPRDSHPHRPTRTVRRRCQREGRRSVWNCCLSMLVSRPMVFSHTAKGQVRYRC